MSSNPAIPQSEESGVDPLSVLDSADPGDDTQRRFRYQACIAATHALSLLDSASQYIAIYCEHHDDVVLERRDGMLVAIQVKTRSESRIPLKASDESIQSTLARFVLKDRQFPKRFFRFQIVTNGGFWEVTKDRHNISYILSIVQKEAEDVSLVDPAVKSTLDGLVTVVNRRLNEDGLIPLNAETTLGTLRKTFVISSAGLDDIEARVIRAVQQCELLRGKSSEVGVSIALALIGRAERAASRPPDSVTADRAILTDDPIGAIVQSAIQQKKITAEDVRAVFAEHGVRASFNEEGNIVSPSSDTVISPISTASMSDLAPAVQHRPSLHVVPDPTINTTLLSVDEIEAQGQFKVISSLSDSGHPRAALEAVNALRAQYWAKVSQAMRAKIANCQATVAFRLDNLSGALNFLEEALAYDPLNVVILANLANIFLVLGDPVKSLEYAVKVRVIEPVNEAAAAAYLQALHATKQDERLEAELAEMNNAWMLVSPLCQAALASIAHDKGEYERAKQLLQKVLKTTESTSQDPQSLMLLGSVLSTPISERLTSEQRSSDRLRDYEYTELLEAERAYNSAIDILANYDSRNWLHSALVSRAGVRYMLGDLDRALKDCECVLDNDSNDWSALENKGRILMAMGHFEEAASVLETLWSLIQEDKTHDGIEPTLYVSSRKGTQLRDAVLYTLAIAYTRSGQPDKVLQILGASTEALEEIGTQPEDFLRAELLLHAASDPNSNLADGLAQKIEDKVLIYLRSSLINDPKGHALLSQYHANRGEITEAISQMREALNLASGSLKITYQRTLAHLLYQACEYQEASDLFRSILSDSDDPYFPLFVHSLYQSKQYKEALEIASKVRSTHGVRPEISSIEVELLEKEGNLSEARQVLMELIAKDSDAYQYHVRLSYIEYRDGNHKGAKSIVEAISYDSISGRPDLLMNIAQLRDLLGIPGFLRFAYRAQRLASDDSGIWHHYMGLFHKLPPEGDEGRDQLRERDIVEVGDAVILKCGTEMIPFIIEPEEPVSASRNEIAPHDERALRLIGRSIGDKVTFSGAFIESDEYEIIKIQHRYLYAFQEKIQKMSVGRLIHPSMQAFHFEEKDDLLRVLDAFGERVENKPDPWLLYENEFLPFAALAKGLNCSVIDLWIALSTSTFPGIFAFLNTSEEQKKQKRTLEHRQNMVVSLDLTALLTIVYLGIDKDICSKFKQILVSQAILDYLLEYEQSSKGITGTKSIRLPNNKYFLLTEEDRTIMVQRLISAARSMVVVPTRGLLEVDEKHTMSFGIPTLAAILTAEEHNTVLYADDYPLREFARELKHIVSIDTQAVLTSLHENDGLSKEQHASAQTTLARAQYRQVYMDSDLLFHLLESKAYFIDDDVRSAFGLFNGPTCDETVTLNVMAKIVREVWYRNLLLHQKTEVLDLALTTISINQNLRHVLRRWLPLLKNFLFFTPHIFENITDYINAWVSQRPTHNIR